MEGATDPSLLGCESPYKQIRDTPVKAVPIVVTIDVGNYGIAACRPFEKYLVERLQDDCWRLLVPADELDDVVTDPWILHFRFPVLGIEGQSERDSSGNL